MAKQPSLVDGVERLIGTAAEFGAALASAADKATAGGREPAAGPPGETAVAAIVRHGVSTAANLVRHVADAGQSARAAATGLSGAMAGAAGAEAPAGPIIAPGGSLRVPLSIENPGREPMKDLIPAVQSWLRDGDEARPPAAVRFLPASLDIEPRDFEKLTVFVDVAEDAEPGRYRLDIALGAGTRTSLVFTVAPQGEDSSPG